MTYIIAIVSIALLIAIYFILINRKDKDNKNILEDMTVIGVNKEDLEKHAIEISRNHSFTRNLNSRRRIMNSLDLSYRKILESYEEIDKAVRNKREVASASEWLLDNLYLIEKEYKHIKYNMPKAYYRNLPVIDKGILKGYPRIYHIAIELVSHTDGKIDEETIERFIYAYQTSSVLTSGELWALPIMLRIALIQNISKISEKIVFNLNEKLKADEISDKFIKALETNTMSQLIADISGKNTDFTAPFTERFLKIIRENGLDCKEIYRWIDEKLEIKETNSEKMITLEHQLQAGYQCSLGNSISSIREVEALNWRESFERLSYVENVLRKDPANIYSEMDFESRDYYRHRLEKLAKAMNKPESFIAKKAVQCAEEAEINEHNEYERHVGYYILDDGIECLKSKSAFKDKGIRSVSNKIKKDAVKYYIGAIVIFTFALIGMFLILSYVNDSERILWRYLVAALVLLIPCSEVAISLLNWSINHLNDEAFIPKIEFKEGIGEENKTVVVIPTIVNNVDKVHELINNMEVYYLANADRDLYFALLSDFKDSNEKENDEDKYIVENALEDIRKLNNKYCKNREDIFYFFGRYRQYNEREKKWIGWERKRGKLAEFNSLIRGNPNTSYDVISGYISNFYNVKYVITLDCDTQLPRDSARKLIGAMAHILNKPHIDEDKKMVVRGYGLMQPRISISTLSANKTIFSMVFSGETGIDTYTTAISDVYQDTFGEGIFTGKGIYHVDTFNYMLKDEVPENSILSHDLLEGSYVRTALVTDIEFIDGYPAYYMASIKRLHRWVRGDWQLLPWLKKKKSINTLSKWKMIDNLRRSLLAPAIIILIALSFQVLPDGNDKWIVAAILALISPLIFDVTESVASPIRGISMSGKINNNKTAMEQVFLIFCFLPFVAYTMVDAIVRTIYRVYISKKNLLEWQTAADVEARSGTELKDYIAFMWKGSFISIILLFLAFMKSIDAGIIMLPSSVVWFLCPWIACYISMEEKEKGNSLSREQKALIRRIARKTWAYFEDFVNEKNNWLAPDNYQEDPNNGVAHRTSPTNIAMGITSNLVAYDLGYIGIFQNVDRIERILTSVDDLKGYKGHLYNWYNTVTKEPLNPKYVSTVDSGNLAGYLWLLVETLEEYLNNPLINKNFKSGILDTICLAEEEINQKLKIHNFYSEQIKKINTKKFDIFDSKTFYEELLNKISEINNKSSEELYWNEKLKISVEKALYELRLICPWIDTVLSENAPEAVRNKLDNLARKVSVKKSKDEIEQLLLNEASLTKELVNSLKQTVYEITKLINKIDALKEKSNNMVCNTDFKMLFDKKRGLFSIGYDVERDTLGKSYYDLLASEARQASFVAIAKGDIDAKHWFKLGRSMANIWRNKGLVSWTGTMFEYLMPLLIMKPYPNTLLSETYKSVVEGQKRYGKIRKVPWGISESAYRAFDVSLNYQYKAFGIPGIGLKRGLKNELVVSPYSTILALQVDLTGGLKNIERLIGEGLEGKYGLYEAIDYTKERMQKEKLSSIVKCFMVHHEGMSLMSIDNVLNKNILRERFHRISEVKATELLLQEKVPKVVVYERDQRFDETEIKEEKQNIILRRFDTAKTSIPEVQLLSNGSYSWMINNSGSGYGKKGEMSAYRWKEDVTSDSSGMFFYIKDIKTSEYWSSTYEPCKKHGDSYEVIFSPDKAEFKRKDGEITTHSEVTLSSEDDAEIRRISLSNNGKEVKIIEITSYCEVTLTTFSSDIVHPAFSNLFIRTEYVKDLECIIANRRPRAKGQKTPYIVQCFALEGKEVGVTEYETSRVNFIGRGRDLTNPIAMEGSSALGNSKGAVLDPIISIRKRIKIEPGETVKIAYTTGIAESKAEAVELASKYKEMKSIDRVFEIAFTQSLIQMKYLGIKSPQANLYQTMASKILYLSSLYKEREEYIKRIKRGQSSLWKYGISGDLPIVLVVVDDEKHKELVRQMLNAHEYWRTKGLKVDLVILNMQNISYIQPLQDSIRDLISTSYARDKQNKPGGVFLYNRAAVEEEDKDLLIAISRIVLYGNKGSLIKQVNEVKKQFSNKELIVSNKSYTYEPYRFNINKLEYFNEYGGFDLENNQYVIILREGRNTPAPWINVVANKDMGFIVSERGASYTWCKNSRENKLTSWSNDWVRDLPGEALYIRDEENGDVWSILPSTIRDKGEYIIEHGFGYSNFKHEAKGIIGEANMFVPLEDKVKICKIKLKNNSSTDRKLSLTYFTQLVLGVVKEHNATHIATYLNKEKNYIYAQNPYSEHFGSLYAYLKIIGGEGESFTGSRTEFIGRGGTLEEPEALKKVEFSNEVGAGVDPCFAENSKIILKKGEEKNLVIVFGQDESLNNIEILIEKYMNFDTVKREFEKVKDYWKKITNCIKVNTPDKAMNIMLNGWLLYQTIVCRIWARSAFYQSGGAFGFRDQLQDVMAAGYVNPEMAREHILYSATRQFIEGDVQHWWHPVVDSGIRTRFSDDLLWLPYVTADYIKRTGDYSILDEKAEYLEDEPLKEGEDERYTISKKSQKVGTIYEHCIKAIEKSLKFGPHNIPLMGSGDWNDGMSEVGNKGRGESVWLGWFLYSILDDFKDICKIRNDQYRLQRYIEMKDFIKENLNKNAWDGGWYRRAYFDDGTPLGSIENDECQIDSLSQSWAVISKAGEKEKVEEAMNALERHLIKEETGMVLLLTPAFADSKLEPGYIKGYVPGVRENGGQYTHASTWVVLAMALMGNGDKAHKVYSMLNPINHSKSYYNCERYKVEPYVMAADVYGREPHIGRGGWTWYTGAAGWMYRVAVEGILGLKFKGKEGFVVEPALPEEWSGFELQYKNKNSNYNIKVYKGENASVTMNGEILETGVIPMTSEGEHEVIVVLESKKSTIESQSKSLNK
ncbi:N,N'-diacetylchitobiose phosphorylase [Clostridium homopropionicum DSM 5847]|uniref:N,N'-diacetylchitobiose phosphorylase n=1 Tax=Clostridium homopropionicum DSM 5847 TaxID=1121318 RepID=A0A0L6ZCU5_9CLOT|nr:glucoamylase family protein [Clostridium homopropionicum]KOA20799.1 N,N'-diacetylchitobiose phosphorylase [Clostridium homopropionicum DSM 5847]SFF88870.1 Cellobiose phosphorylase [Clostridium homopropionicum]